MVKEEMEGLYIHLDLLVQHDLLRILPLSNDQNFFHHTIHHRSKAMARPLVLGLVIFPFYLFLLFFLTISLLPVRVPLIPSIFSHFFGERRLIEQEEGPYSGKNRCFREKGPNIVGGIAR